MMMSEPFKFPASGQFVIAGGVRALVTGYGGDDETDTGMLILMNLSGDKWSHQSDGFVPIPDGDLTDEEIRFRKNWATSINK